MIEDNKFENLQNPSSDIDLFVEMATEAELLRHERDEAIVKANAAIRLLKDMIILAEDAGLILEQEAIDSREFLISIGELSPEE